MSIEQEQFFLILNRIEKKLISMEDQLTHIKHQNKAIFNLIRDHKYSTKAFTDPPLDLSKAKQQLSNMDLFKIVFDEIADTRKKYFPIYYAVSREELKFRLHNRYNIEFEETSNMINYFVKMDLIYEIACMPDHYRKVSDHW